MELFQNWNELRSVPLGISDRKLFTGEQVMLVQNTVHPHELLPLHSHPHEQILMVLSGACDVTTDGVTQHLTEGGLAWFPSGAEHSVLNTEDVPLVALDVFSPIREDFLGK